MSRVFRFDSLTQSASRKQRFHDSLSAGLPSLDDDFRGLPVGSLIVMAGCPVTTHSILAHQIALATARQVGPVLIISESRGARLSAQFMMSILSTLGMPAPYDLPLFFAETSRIDLHFLLSAVRDMPEPPRLILIDGYEGIRVDDAPSSPLESLPSLLKLLAQCLTTDILVLHDLPGFSEERSDFRPRLEDLAGSDPLRDVADLVLTVYWPALYDPDQYEDESPERDDVFVSLLRNRHGTLHSRKLRHRHTHLKRAPWVIFEEVETAG